MRQRSALLMLLGLTLTGCSTVTTAIDPKLLCSNEAMQPIYPSRKDVLTEGTKDRLARDLAAKESICGYRPPPPKPVASQSKGGRNG